MFFIRNFYYLVKKKLNKKIVGIFVLTLLITNVIPAIGITIEITNKSENNVSTDGWLEEIDGVKILHLSGSYYEMGYQHGSLLKDDIQQNLRAYLAFLELAGVTYDDLLDLWDIMKDYVPQDYKDELQGLADGSDLTFEDGAAAIMMEVLNHDITACFHAAAWDSATIDGNLYHFKSNDWSLIIKDPDTGIYLQENQVIIVRIPDDGYASVYPAFAGTIVGNSGINDQGVCLTTSVSWCMNDISNHGIPFSLRGRMTLDKASTSDEAIEILNNNRTRGWNFIISDVNQNCYVLEQSATNSYIGTYDNLEESNHPFWEIENVVRRGNCFIEKNMASLQRKIYEPRSFLHWFFYSKITKLFGFYDSFKYEYFPEFMHYKVLSDEIENHLGNLDLNVSMSILRDCYSGKTNFKWNFFQNILGWYRSVTWQWAICPETGDMVISFADANKSAHINTVHYFNFNNLVNSTPP